ncbi:MAG: peptidoglycan bridge formation glycyltransferase FemA/FemB family protein [Candidatus Vogelbacteria bacterium]|nr:peptidoglycan bridge formation glycyltransferase FemA/FemB family protein [Candidatus Vogelbacteria bacterium]
MAYIFREINKGEYENLTEGKSLPLTQNAFYGEWQSMNSKKVWRYSVEESSKTVGVFQVVKNNMAYGKSYLYVPHGPVFFKEPGVEFMHDFDKFVLDLLMKERAIFLRFDPTWGLRPQVRELIGSVAPKYLYDGSYQPKFEWILDINKSEEELLAWMKKVNRYTIRQAERLGVTVEIVRESFGKYFNKFYELISKTAARDEFSHFTVEYYQKIFDACEKDRNAFLTVGSYGGEVLLVNLYLKFGDTVYFLFSGSDDSERRVGYTYLAQWEAIKESKRLGYKIYNFGGYAPENCNYIFYKKWSGFSDFKRRFGGRMIEYGDFHDIVGDKFWYLVYKTKRFVSSLLRNLK